MATDTPIENASATETPSNYEICQRTGQKLKVGELKKEWTGLKVRPQSWEPRHPLDRVRAVGLEQSRGSPSPEPADQFIPTTYLDQRVQFLPTKTGGVKYGPYFNRISAVQPVMTVPATLTSFTVAWRGRIGRAKQRLCNFANYTTYGTGLTRFNFTISGATDNSSGVRLSCSSFADSTHLQWGIGARAQTITGPPSIDPTPTNGDVFQENTDWMFICTGNGATGDIAFWHYDYAAALLWETQTGERLAPKFWGKNSAFASVSPSSGMVIADVEEFAMGAQGTDTTNILGIGVPVTDAYAYGQLALVALCLSDTSSAWADMSSDTVRRALLGSPTGWGLGTPTVHFEGAAADWYTNKGNGGSVLYCNNDATQIANSTAPYDVANETDVNPPANVDTSA